MINISKKIHIFIIFSLIFYAFSFLFHSDNSFDQDLGRHIKLGWIIWQNKFVPNTNLFTYTYPDFPFVNHHYLFELFVFAGINFLGPQVLLFLKISILLLIIFLTLSVINRNNWVYAFPIAFLFLHTLRERTEFRPEIFSFLFTALTVFILNRQGRLIFLLPLIQFLWINTHIYFIVGLAIQAIFFIHFLLSKKYQQMKMIGIILLISLIISLLNPNTFTGLIYPLKIFGNYGYTIAENQNIFLLEKLGFKNPNYLFSKISLVIITFSLVISFFRGLLNYKNLGLALMGGILALMHVRSLPYLFFLSFPAIINSLPQVKSGFKSKIFLLITIVLLTYESILYLNGDYYRFTDNQKINQIKFTVSAEKALDFVLINKLPSPIFNNFDIGSYIEYRSFPEYKTFVDGRPEAFPIGFFQDVYIPAQYHADKFYQVEQKYKLKTIIFSHTDQTPWAKTFLQFIVKNPQWRIVYLDDFMIILLKNEYLSQLNSINLAQISPDNYDFSNHLSYLRIALFLNLIGELQTSKIFSQKAVEIFPDSPLANKMMHYFTSASTSDTNPDASYINYYQKSQNKIWW